VENFTYFFSILKKLSRGKTKKLKLKIPPGSLMGGGGGVLSPRLLKCFLRLSTENLKFKFNK
jgi:hypothetical protein